MEVILLPVDFPGIPGNDGSDSSTRGIHEKYGNYVIYW